MPHLSGTMATWVGDIGGSSSRWAVIAGGVGTELPGPFPGFNPLVGDPSAMQAALREAAHLLPGATATQVVAYGAGCGAPVRARCVQQALAGVWPGAQVQVESDLLGAARGLYGDGKGLVLNLGTGMNSGYYDGLFLHTPMPSLGYMLGDEGSGADIGKHLLRDALYGSVPGAIAASLFPQGLDLPAVLEATYRSPGPQAYVASFTAKLAGHVDHPYVHDLVMARFFAMARLLERFFAPDERREVKAVGSVAYGFQGLLATALDHYGMALMGVLRDPLPGLIAFHSR